MDVLRKQNGIVHHSERKDSPCIILVIVAIVLGLFGGERLARVSYTVALTPSNIAPVETRTGGIPWQANNAPLMLGASFGSCGNGQDVGHGWGGGDRATATIIFLGKSGAIKVTTGCQSRCFLLPLLR